MNEESAQRNFENCNLKIPAAFKMQMHVIYCHFLRAYAC